MIENKILISKLYKNLNKYILERGRYMKNAYYIKLSITGEVIILLKKKKQGIRINEK